MGIICKPEIFQDNVSNLIVGLEFACTYFDDLLCLSKGHFDEHLEDTENILKRLRNENMRINATKSSFGKIETDYLGCVVTCEVINSQQKKINAIIKIG